jgi:hypothetical protein
MPQKTSSAREAHQSDEGEMLFEDFSERVFLLFIEYSARGGTSEDC